MSDVDDIETNLINKLADGVAEKQIGDIRYRNYEPDKIYDVLKKLQADKPCTTGPFIPVRFSGRTF
jgi:hypothetical protein